MEPRGLTQVKVAQEQGIKLARLNEIINGKRRVTEETALLLGRYMGCPAATWLKVHRGCRLTNRLHGKALPYRAGSEVS